MATKSWGEIAVRLVSIWEAVQVIVLVALTACLFGLLALPVVGVVFLALDAAGVEALDWVLPVSAASSLVLSVAFHLEKRKETR